MNHHRRLATIDMNGWTWEEQARVDRWLDANGCRWHVPADSTITLTQTPNCRKDPKSLARFGRVPINPRTGEAPTRRVRMWQTVPIEAVA